MPELPEVETIRRVLERKLAGHRILNLTISHEKPLRPQSALALQAHARGQRIIAVERRAKYLLLRLEEGSLLVHLGMTGQLFAMVSGKPAPADMPGLPDKHTHVTLTLDRGQLLYFRDIRRFGHFRWITDQEATRLSEGLGPEPLSPQFTPGTLLKSLTRRQTSIKALLLNQRIVAGVGNIYADEALFRARIAPQILGRVLTLEQCTRLHAAIREVLKEAIHYRGTTLSDYYDPESRRGGFQDRLKVYGREGEPCVTCQTPVRKGIVAQRGTHWCPKCQPWKKSRRK
jgi:formamidopyrimidine-DNA glycosylase